MRVFGPKSCSALFFALFLAAGGVFAKTLSVAELQPILLYLLDDSVQYKTRLLHQGMATQSGENSETLVIYQGQLFFSVGSAFYKYSNASVTKLIDFHGGQIHGDTAPIEFQGSLHYSADKRLQINQQPFKGVEPWFFAEGNQGQQNLSGVVDVYSGVQGAYPKNFIEFDNRLFFSAENMTNGREWWATSGANHLFQPNRVTDLVPGLGSADPGKAAIYKEKLAFAANTETLGRELWLVHGNGSGLFPEVVTNINTSGDSDPEQLTVFGDHLYFTAQDAQGDRELWRYHYPSSVYNRVADLNPLGSSDPQHLQVNDDRLYFSAVTNLGARELFYFDLQSEQISQLSNFEVAGAGLQAQPLVMAGDDLYFVANNGLQGQELWRFTKVSNQVLQLFDLNPGQSHAAPEQLFWDDEAGVLYFSGNDGKTGQELWAYLAGADAVCQLSDIAYAGLGSSPRLLTKYQGSLAFFASHSSTAVSSLWLVPLLLGGEC